MRRRPFTTAEAVEQRYGRPHRRYAKPALAGERHQARLRPHMQRRDPLPYGALGQRLPHHFEPGLREVANPAMHQMRHRLARSTGEVVLLHQSHCQPAARRIARDRRADDATANHCEVQPSFLEFRELPLHGRQAPLGMPAYSIRDACAAAFTRLSSDRGQPASP